MIVTYYKDDDYKYATRKRNSSLPSTTAAQDNTQLVNGRHRVEIQKKVLVGDGETTSIKTSSLNICDYVSIKEDANDQNPTRWFVFYYDYLNGKQINLHLKRDVIGEFGLSNLFGNVERGYLGNDNKLINRKELNLNEILKYREAIKPNTETVTYNNVNYQCYKILNKDNEKIYITSSNDELWGFLYFAVQENGKLDIDIPNFSGNINPDIFSWLSNIRTSSSYLVNFTKYISNYDNDYKGTYLEFWVHLKESPDISTSQDIYCNIFIRFYPTNSGISFSVTTTKYDNPQTGKLYIDLYSNARHNVIITVQSSNVDYFLNNIGNIVATNFLSNTHYNETMSVPDVSNVRISDDASFDIASSSIGQRTNDIMSGRIYDVVGSSSNVVYSGDVGRIADNYNYIIKKALDETTINIGTVNYTIYLPQTYSDATISYSSSFMFETVTIGLSLSSSQSKNISLTPTRDVLDEPYYIIGFPLYGCSIIRDVNGVKTIQSLSRDKWYYLYNSFIKSLSGENGYIIDAQIFPYYPQIYSWFDISHTKDTSISGDMENFTARLFLVKSGFDISASKQFKIKDVVIGTDSGIEYVDINKRKQYTKRHYSILSPDQNGKERFDFYDYVDQNYSIPSGSNYITQSLNFTIKVSLKPFSLICSLIINRVGSNPISGITYDSDMRGCQPNSGGYQASLASNAFQEYKRQNSTYQQVFNKQQEAITKQQEVERKNEDIQATMGTLGAAASAALAAGSASGGGFIGAAIGAVTAIGAGGLADNLYQEQKTINNKMRDYELSYNKEIFNLNLQAIKDVPNSINRISSFNDIIKREFYFYLELYECSSNESVVVDEFFNKYAYEIGVYGEFSNYWSNGWFIKGRLLTSQLNTNLHILAQKELEGGIYYYD